MTKYPLFGQDSQPLYTSKILALIGTGIFWFIFLILMIFIKPINKKPKYKTVQIVLASDVKKESQEKESTAAQAAPAQKIVEEKAVAESPKIQPKVEKIKETPKTAVNAKKQESKKASPKKESPKTNSKSQAPAKREAPKLYKSVDDQLDDIFSGESSTVSDDSIWDSFDSDVAESSKKEYVPVESGVVQSNAQAQVYDSNQRIKSQETTSNHSTAKASSEVQNMLADIEGASGKAQSWVNGQAKSQTNSTSLSAENDFEWTGGLARKLLFPSNPEIKISKENQSKINFSQAIIKFTVDENGYVERSSISVQPAIPQSVLDEIANQISDWWFDSGSGKANASLIWKIQRG
ncbi:MAG: hypothetical protein K5866_07030 [Treponema sp.]|nr:hypothetical protein [Treponema sp.]